MEKYERVLKPRPDFPIMDNEIRIAGLGRPRNYITHAITLLGDRGVPTVVLKGMGSAISKAVKVAEIIKRRIPYLHQNTAIGSAPVTDNWEPVEEGILPLQTMRQVSTITITLSTSQLDTSSIGYQPPLSVDQVKPMLEYEYEGEDSQFVSGKARSRGRGGIAASHNQNGDNLPPRVQGHGRGRSRTNSQYGNGGLNENGMGDHTRSRFGYDGNYNDNGFRRGQGRGQGRIGGNGEDGGEIASRGRGRGRGRAQGRGQELIPMGRLNEPFAREGRVG
ncbi:hypothetical protein SUGI_0546240 [Cryptomeria japonica]|uniref:uncharacterized protein LOC131032817 n=1 Tax=Cryptomeria japonica TaxID=3369 RepID=UPI002408E690|nr:uncharacterized protein LOC131032817 [Cryptomeria japonica]GLJ27834.1 hypothetical protein SUGI_0546240 [Cryptomeria japonica]